MPPVAQPQEKRAGLAYWANRVLEECHRAAAGFAADPVHDLRVAIRRCRSMADGFLSVDPDPAWKQMKRLAKPLFSSLGELRDTQVMLEWVAKLSAPGDPLGEILSASLAQKELALKAASHDALLAFDTGLWASLNAHLTGRGAKIPLEGLVFQHLALERWMDARELHRRALRNRSGFAYHQLRIGIKRFRYTVENFLPHRHHRWSKDLRALQDALGEVHDLDVLRAMIKTHPEVGDAECAHWQKRISEERQARLDLYRQLMLGKDSRWNIWRSELPEGEQLAEAALEKLRTWASFLDPDPPHSTRVTQFALQLYDGLSRCGAMTARPDDRRIVQAAAILHEVGRSQLNGHGGHQKRGKRMVSKLKPPIGWSEGEIGEVALLVRYHRGVLPLGTHSPFVGVATNRRSELLRLMGILRLANAFDGSHDGAVSSIKVERHTGFVVILGEGLRRLSENAQRVAEERYLLDTTSRRALVIRPIAKRATTGSRTSRLPSKPQEPLDAAQPSNR
ncbi:MAG TPA: CHAD domain-containing protein [Terriglobales bacterium]|nr:CHAD domain-containing protein [Terriglobales bacterium]